MDHVGALLNSEVPGVSSNRYASVRIIVAWVESYANAMHLLAYLSTARFRRPRSSQSF